MSRAVHTSIQIRSEYAEASPAYQREFDLSFQEKLYDLKHATRFSIIVCGFNPKQHHKVCRAVASNPHLTHLSVRGDTPTYRDPGPTFVDYAAVILESAVTSPHLTSLEFGFQLNPYACRHIEKSSLTHLTLLNPNLSTLEMVAHIAPQLTSLKICGTGINQTGGGTAWELTRVVQTLAAAPLKCVDIDAFGMRARADGFNELKFYYPLLAATKTIEDLILDVRSHNIDPEWEILAENIRKNTTLKSLTLTGHDYDAITTIALLRTALAACPSPHAIVFTFCGQRVPLPAQSA